MAIARVIIHDENLPSDIDRVHWVGTQGEVRTLQKEHITTTCEWYEMPRTKEEFLRFLKENT
jgi:hypothetical protein